MRYLDFLTNPNILSTLDNGNTEVLHMLEYLSEGTSVLEFLTPSVLSPKTALSQKDIELDNKNKFFIFKYCTFDNGVDQQKNFFLHFFGENVKIELFILT